MCKTLKLGPLSSVKGGEIYPEAHKDNPLKLNTNGSVLHVLCGSIVPWRIHYQPGVVFDVVTESAE